MTRPFSAPGSVDWTCRWAVSALSTSVDGGQLRGPWLASFLGGAAPAAFGVTGRGQMLRRKRLDSGKVRATDVALRPFTEQRAPSEEAIAPLVLLSPYLPLLDIE